MKARETTVFGERLRESRLKQSISQGALAKRLGVSPQYICMLETGRSRASKHQILRLCAVLNIDPTPLILADGVGRGNFKLRGGISPGHDRVGYLLQKHWDNLSDAKLDEMLRVLNA